MAEPLEGISVLFPISANTGNVAELLKPWLTVLDHTNRTYEIILIVDGPTDPIKTPLDQLTASNPRIKVLSLDQPTGYGACIAKAIPECQQPLIFYSALTGGWNPADLPRMLQAISFKDEYSGKTVEMVNGHRRGIAEPSGRAFRRKLFSLFVRIVYGTWPDPGKGYLGKAETWYWYRARLQFGLRFGDPNSCFKMFRKHVFDRIVIQSKGEFVHTELLAKANFLSTLMDEIALSDQCVPDVLPDMKADRLVVFKKPKFRSLIPTSGNTQPVQVEQPVLASAANVVESSG